MDLKTRRTAGIGLMALPAVILGGARLLTHGNKRQRQMSASEGTINVRKAAVGASAIGALATGAIALGALAIGALAIGRLAIRRLVIGKTRLRSLEIGELKVDQLRVSELTVTDTLTTPAGKRERASNKRRLISR